MAGKKWSYWRRFKNLGLWEKISFFGSCASVFGLILYFWPITQKVELTDEQLRLIIQSGANTTEVNNLLQSIQEERNEAINDSAQVEFINAISNIYKTISPESNIILNQVFFDSITKKSYRSDIIIEQILVGHPIKLLFRLNPYDNPIGKSEVLSFQDHIEKIGASKGIMITKGKYRTEAFKPAEKVSIDLVTFKDSKSKSWNDEVKVPVIVKNILVDVLMSSRFTAVGDNFVREPGYEEISFDGGKTSMFMDELFYNKWNQGEFDSIVDNLLKDNKNGSGRIWEIKDENMSIKFSENGVWMPSNRLTFEYFPRMEYRFNYLIPDKFEELKNLSEKRFIYARYEFEMAAITELSKWKLIKNITQHLNHISQPIVLMSYGIIGRDNMSMDPKEFKLTKVSMK